MPALNLFKRNPDKPRLTIRERFRDAAARMMPRSRGSRAGGGTDTGRRALMAGSLASAALAPIGALAAPGGDSELLALIHEWMEKQARLYALYPIQAEAEARYLKNLPERPEELYVKNWDFHSGLPCSTGDTVELESGRRAYTRQAVEELRSTRRTMQDWSRATWDDEGGWTPGRKPDPKAQARADEIVAAWDRYCDALQDAREQSGYAEAREAIANLVETIRELDERIARTRANTLQGMLMKARMAAEDPAYEGVEDQIENALHARESTGQMIGLSLVRDLLHVNGGNSCPPLNIASGASMPKA